MRPEHTSTDRPFGGTITYKAHGSFTEGLLTIDVPVDAPAPRSHLVKAATADLPRHQAALFKLHIDEVASGHLQQATGTHAHITNEGQQVRVHVVPPTPLSERPPMYGEAPTYMDPADRRELTAAQQAALPAVATSIRKVIPTALQPHADDLAHLMVQEVPTQADVLRAYQRTSLTEVQEYFNRPPAPQDLPLATLPGRGSSRVEGPGNDMPALSLAGAAYWPADSTQRARINVELTVNRDTNPATAECIATAHEALDGGAHHIDTSIQMVADRHLEELSGTRAYFTDNGYYIGVTAVIDNGTTGDAAPGTTTDDKTPLLATWQQALLPELIDAVGQCLPDHERHLTHTLALDLVRNIPAASDVIDALDRVTLFDVIHRHGERMEAFARDLLPHDPEVPRDAAHLQPALQAFSAVRVARLSFSQHPAAALEQPHSTSPASTSPTVSAHRAGPSIDR